MRALRASAKTPRPLASSAAAFAVIAGGAALAASLALTGCLKLQTRTLSIAASEPAPEFELPDQRGRPHSLASLLADGPAIVVFYRGYW